MFICGRIPDFILPARKVVLHHIHVAPSAESDRSAYSSNALHFTRSALIAPRNLHRISGSSLGVGLRSFGIMGGIQNKHRLVRT